MLAMGIDEGFRVSAVAPGGDDQQASDWTRTTCFANQGRVAPGSRSTWRSQWSGAGTPVPSSRSPRLIIMSNRTRATSRCARTGATRCRRDRGRRHRVERLRAARGVEAVLARHRSRASMPAPSTEPW